MKYKHFKFINTFLFCIILVALVLHPVVGVAAKQQQVTKIEQCNFWLGCQKLIIYSNKTYILHADDSRARQEGLKIVKQGQLPEQYLTQFTELINRYGSFDFHLVEGCGEPCDENEARVTFRGNGSLPVSNEKKKEISEYLQMLITELDSRHTK